MDSYCTFDWVFHQWPLTELGTECYWAFLLIQESRKGFLLLISSQLGYQLWNGCFMIAWEPAIWSVEHFKNAERKPACVATWRVTVYVQTVLVMVSIPVFLSLLMIFSWQLTRFKLTWVIQQPPSECASSIDGLFLSTVFVWLTSVNTKHGY